MFDPDDFVRVTDQDTGVKRSIRKNETHLGNYNVLKASPIDPRTGDLLPPEPKSVETTTDGQKATDKKDS